MTTSTRTYIDCPHCDKAQAFRVCHILAEPGDWTWGCEGCGSYIRITSDGKGNISAELRRKNDRDLVAIEVATEEARIIFLCSAPAANMDKHRYLFEQRQCPSNWFGDHVGMAYIDPAGVGIAGDFHGVGRVVGSAPFEDWGAFAGECNRDLGRLHEMLKTMGVPGLPETVREW